jgi:hypothetical protein
MIVGIAAGTGAYQWDTTVNGPYTCLATYWRVVSDRIPPSFADGEQFRRE